MNIADLFLAACGAIALISIPMILKRVPPNRIYGFRTPETLADRALWYQVNQFAGWALFAAAALGAILLASAPANAPESVAFAILAFVLPVLAALGASYVYMRKVDRAGTGKRK
jgi:uncharacterized membrane protein